MHSRGYVQFYINFTIIDVRSDEFKQLVSEKLESSHVFLVSEGNEMHTTEVFDTIESFTLEKALYTDSIVVLFYPFFTTDNRNLLPEEFLKLYNAVFRVDNFQKVVNSLINAVFRARVGWSE